MALLNPDAIKIMEQSGGIGRAPQYIDEAEGLLQGAFFYDEGRSELLYEDFDTLQAQEELGARQLIYTGALRILAEARADDRAMAKEGRVGYDPQAFNDTWSITPSRLREISHAYKEDTGILARRLAIVNNAEQATDQSCGGEGYAWLYDHQRPYLDGIVNALQQGPGDVKLPDWYQSEKTYRLQGILLNAPTGSGKTAIMARAAAAIGTGKPPVEHADDSRHNNPVKTLLVVPSQQLIAQILGESGKSTFRQLAPGLSLGAYYALSKNVSGDVVVTSIEMFTKEMSDGWLGGEYFDFLFVDEAHHLNEPKFLEAVVERWKGPVLGFTATPAYSEDRDTRNILGHEVHHGDVLDYIDQGRLSELSIYTAAVYPEDIEVADEEVMRMTSQELRKLRHKALAQVACDFIKPLVAEGRRGLVFCQPGMDAHHARLTRDMLRQTELPNGQVIRAGTIGYFQGSSNSQKNQAVINDINNGELDVVTMVDMGREGLDLNDISFIVVASATVSLLRLQQIMGRGLRPSENFKDTVLGQFVPVGFGAYYGCTQTFLGALGEDKVIQGVKVRPISSAGPLKSLPKQEPDFPERFQRILDRINTRVLERAFIRLKEDVLVPPDYIDLRQFIAGKDVNPYNAKAQLLRVGYDFVARREFNEDGELRIVRYYEPAAATLFTENPIPPQVGELKIKNLTPWVKANEVRTIKEIAETLGVNKKLMMRDYLTDEERRWIRMRKTSGTKARVAALKGHEAEAVIQRLRQKLIIPPHVITVRAAADLLDVKYNTLLELVRRLRQELGVLDIERGKGTYPCLTWKAVQTLEKRYGRKLGVGVLKYDLLPQSPEDDPERIMYARKIQRRLFKPNWLPPEYW